MEPDLVAEIESGKQYRRRLRLRFLWKRDGEGCFYCRCPLTEDDATFDHFIPKSAGGTDALENLRVSCGPCNHGKGNSIPVGRPWTQVERQASYRARMRPSRLHVSLADVWPTDEGAMRGFQ